MQEKSISENELPTRARADRYLRSYVKWNDMQLSSRKSVFDFGFESSLDETIIQSQMFDIRSLVMNVGDAKQKMFLYLHYIKGIPVEKCTKILGVSRRTAFRLKNRALDSICELMKENKVFFEKIEE